MVNPHNKPIPTGTGILDLYDYLEEIQKKPRSNRAVRRDTSKSETRKKPRSTKKVTNNISNQAKKTRKKPRSNRAVRRDTSKLETRKKPRSTKKVTNSTGITPKKTRKKPRSTKKVTNNISNQAKKTRKKPRSIKKVTNNISNMQKKTQKKPLSTNSTQCNKLQWVNRYGIYKAELISVSLVVQWDNEKEAYISKVICCAKEIKSRSVDVQLVRAKKKAVEMAIKHLTTDLAKLGSS